MSIAGPRMVREVNDAMNFVTKNLNEQYVLPHYAKGYYTDTYAYNTNITSKLSITIIVRNITVSGDFESTDIDYLYALDTLANTLVDDDLQNDIGGNLRTNNEFLAFCGTKSAIFTITKNIMICDNEFNVSVTYERNYFVS